MRARVLTQALTLVAVLLIMASPMAAALWTETLQVTGTVTMGNFCPIDATVEITPVSLNADNRGQGHKVSAKISFPSGLPPVYSVDAIDTASIRMRVPGGTGAIPIERVRTIDGTGRLHVEFDGQEVIGLLEGQEAGPVTLEVTGQVNGCAFSGSDTIRFTPRSDKHSPDQTANVATVAPAVTTEGTGDPAPGETPNGPEPPTPVKPNEPPAPPEKPTSEPAPGPHSSGPNLPKQDVPVEPSDGTDETPSQPDRLNSPLDDGEPAPAPSQEPRSGQDRPAPRKAVPASTPTPTPAATPAPSKVAGTDEPERPPRPTPTPRTGNDDDTGNGGGSPRTLPWDPADGSRDWRGSRPRQSPEPVQEPAGPEEETPPVGTPGTPAPVPQPEPSPEPKQPVPVTVTRLFGMCAGPGKICGVMTVDSVDASQAGKTVVVRLDYQAPGSDAWQSSGVSVEITLAEGQSRYEFCLTIPPDDAALATASALRLRVDASSTALLASSGTTSPPVPCLFQRQPHAARSESTPTPTPEPTPEPVPSPEPVVEEPPQPEAVQAEDATAIPTPPEAPPEQTTEH